MAFNLSILRRFKKAEWIVKVGFVIVIIMSVIWGLQVIANPYMLLSDTNSSHVRIFVDHKPNIVNNMCEGDLIKDPSKSSQKGIVDHFHRVVYCDIGKTGTTSWFQLFQKLTKQEKLERSAFFRRHHYKWYSLGKIDRWPRLYKMGLNRLTRGSDAHSEIKDSLPDPRVDYYKFIIVRHPLERLASAYHSRVADHVKKASIIAIKANVSTNTDPKVGVTFEEFLTYVKRPDSEMRGDVDYHWKSYQTLCEPCSIDYDYVGHLETLEDDLEVILPKLKASHMINSFPEKNVGRVQSQKYKHMYFNVSYEILKPVLDKYRVDAEMFGYTFDDYITAGK